MRRALDARSSTIHMYIRRLVMVYDLQDSEGIQLASSGDLCTAFDSQCGHGGSGGSSVDAASGRVSPLVVRGSEWSQVDVPPIQKSSQGSECKAATTCFRLRGVSFVVKASMSFPTLGRVAHQSQRCEDRVKIGCERACSCHKVACVLDSVLPDGDGLVASPARTGGTARLKLTIDVTEANLIAVESIRMVPAEQIVMIHVSFLLKPSLDVVFARVPQRESPEHPKEHDPYDMLGELLNAVGLTGKMRVPEGLRLSENEEKAGS